MHVVFCSLPMHVIPLIRKSARVHAGKDSSQLKARLLRDLSE
jgi:hypothetical protein